MNYQSITAKILIDIKAINFSIKNPYTLTSGRKSPVYVDCRKIISYPKQRNQILNFMQNYLSEKNIKFDLIAGGETAGIPYASFLSESPKRLLKILLSSNSILIEKLCSIFIGNSF